MTAASIQDCFPLFSLFAMLGFSLYTFEGAPPIRTPAFRLFLLSGVLVAMEASVVFHCVPGYGDCMMRVCRATEWMAVAAGVFLYGFFHPRRFASEKPALTVLFYLSIPAAVLCCRVFGNGSFPDGVLYFFAVCALYFFASQVHRDPVFRETATLIIPVFILLAFVSWMVPRRDSPGGSFPWILHSLALLVVFMLLCVNYNRNWDMKGIRRHQWFLARFLSRCMLFAFIVAVAVLLGRGFGSDASSGAWIRFLAGTLIVAVAVFGLWNALRGLGDRMFYPDVDDYRRRLAVCSEYLRKLLNLKTFLSFSNGIFNEFFGASRLCLMVLDADGENGIRIVTADSDRTFRLVEPFENLCEWFEDNPVIQFFEWSGAGEELDRNEFLKKFVTENEINTLLCLPCEGGRLFVLGWMTGGFLSREKLSRIRSASSVFSSCLENILRYEGHKALVIEQMKLAMNELDISRLESENRELQRSYQKIRTLQNDLIKKERKAALTKFSISLDDEISAPLGNLLMAVQYQLERIEKGKGFSDEERGRILGVVVSQSLRIKNILEELRKISDSYSHYGNAGPSG